MACKNLREARHEPCAVAFRFLVDVAVCAGVVASDGVVFGMIGFDVPLNAIWNTTSVMNDAPTAVRKGWQTATAITFEVTTAMVVDEASGTTTRAVDEACCTTGTTALGTGTYVIASLAATAFTAPAVAFTAPAVAALMVK